MISLFLFLPFFFSSFRPDGGVLALGSYGQDVTRAYHVLACLYTSHIHVLSSVVDFIIPDTEDVSISFVTYLCYRI